MGQYPLRDRRTEMALPAHLAKYSGLIDFVVEELLREDAEQTPEKTAPARGTNPAGADRQHVQLAGDDDHVQATESTD